jgi:dienelactone hydrolase
MGEQEFLDKVVARDNGLNVHCLEFEQNREGSSVWLEREDLLLEFTRLVGAAQEGGSTIAECVSTANAVDFADDGSWLREWARTADVSSARADAALADGKILTARSNWLRAMNYYQAAAFPFSSADQAYGHAIASMRRCATNYVRHATPRGEVVQIAWPGGYPLQGYFLPAPRTTGRAPAVICVAEPGQRKEEFLYKAAHYARDRGMAMLAVDLLGAETDAEFEQVVGRRDLEATVGCITDYLVERDDIDESRIAILSDGMRSSFVARGIAFDDRYAAAVCDGGLWDLHEREFLRDRIAAHDPGLMMRPTLSRAARNIKCPVLIAAGERGWLQPERVTELYEQLKAAGRDVTLKIFTNRETAATQGHADNPTLANEFIFDWIESRLGIPTALHGRGRAAAARRGRDA